MPPISDSLTSDSTPSRLQGEFLARGPVLAAGRRMNQGWDGWTAPCKGKMRFGDGWIEPEALGSCLKSGVGSKNASLSSTA